MPKTAIISDIHSNLHALTSVIEDVQSQGCSDIVCVGDIVGYNAYPRECLDYIRSLKCPTVKGNHDEDVVAGVYYMMNPVARQAMEWTREQLDEDQLQWLGRLPYVRMVRSQFAIVHATLDTPKNWAYILNASDATSSFARQSLPVCFHGHTHVPHIYAMDSGHTSESNDMVEELYQQAQYSFQPQEGIKYFINVGSVGQSRDGDPRACYCIYDTDNNIITLRRVDYDIEAAQAAIMAAGLPEFLAERLKTGQ